MGGLPLESDFMIQRGYPHKPAKLGKQHNCSVKRKILQRDIILNTSRGQCGASSVHGCHFSPQLGWCVWDITDGSAGGRGRVVGERSGESGRCRTGALPAQTSPVTCASAGYDEEENNRHQTDPEHIHTGSTVRLVSGL